MAGLGARHAWAVAILCVALLFTSGIILPKLLFRYFEQSFEENKTIIDLDITLSTGNETTGYRANTISSNDFNETLLPSKRFPYDGTSSAADSSTLQIPDTIKRKKREASVEDDNEHFAWSMNLNISRYENRHSLMDGTKKADHNLKRHLDAAIYLAGNGPSKDYNNMQRSLDSAGVFIRSIFGDGDQKLTLKETRESNGETYSLKGSLQAESHTQTIVSEENDKSRMHAREPKRDGRFLFELFGFGRTSTNKPAQPTESKITSENSIDISNSSMSFDKNETNSNFKKDIFGLSSSQETNFDTSKIDFQTEANIKSKHPESSPCSTEDECKPLGILKETILNSQEFRSVANEEECVNCEFSFSNKGNEKPLNDSLDEGNKFSVHSFKSEKLDDFCMNLVHKIGESRTLLSVNGSSKNEKSEETTLSEESELKGLDCFMLFGKVEKRKPDNVIEGSLATEISNNISVKNAERDARIFNWFQFDIGSGRSELDVQITEKNTGTLSSSASTKDEQIKDRMFDITRFDFGSGRSGLVAEVIEEESEDDLTDELNTDNEEETENEPTVQNCITYFRENQNIKRFPKPNLMDIISDSNIEITDFANATISPKLKEQQVKFLIDLLENSAKVCGLDDMESVHTVTEKNKLSYGKFLPATKPARNGDILTRQSITDLDFINTQVTTVNEFIKEIQKTENQRDVRIFGSGDGNDFQSEATLRFVGLRNGEDKLEETPAAVKTKLTDFDDFKEFTEQIESVCGNDCSFGNAADGTDGCHDECHNSPVEQSSNINSNESDSHDNIALNNSYMTESNFSNHNFKLGEVNLTLNNIKNFNESCSCYEHSTGIDISENDRDTECDDCTGSIEAMLDKEFINIENNTLRMEPENTTLNRNHEDYCEDCSDKKFRHDKEINNTESDFFKVLDSTVELSSFKVSENSIGRSEFPEVDMDTEHTKTVESATKMLNIHETVETKNISRIFLRPVFLTGSGDGDLFGDGGGRINLTEENSQFPNLQRRGRLDDTFEVNSCDDCDVDLSDIREKLSIQKETMKDNLKLVTSEGSNIDSKTLKHGVDQFEEESTQTVLMTKVSNWSFSYDVFSKDILDFSDILTTTASEPRFCTSASECNSELNERCVTSTFSSICSCTRAFVRNKVTGKCVQKSSYKTKLNLPAEKFEEDLGNPLSPRYKQRRQDANKLMYYLLKNNPDLAPIIAEVTFAGFSPGSLVMSWEFVLAAENKSEAEIESLLQNDLNAGLADENLKETVPFNVNKAHVLSISNALDPCMSKELNYCHWNSHCLRNRLRPGGYECRCKEDYLDISFNSDYPGEICEVFCSTGYCGNHGKCVWTPGMGPHCVCRDWYFGDRCGIPGKVVVAGFSANIFVIIVLMLVLAIFCKRRRRSYGGNRSRDTSDFGTRAVTAGRVSGVMAEEENV